MRYAQSDRSTGALDLFLRMRQTSIVPNNFTFTSSSVSRDLGRQIHSCMLKFGLNSNVFVSYAVMDAYGKCGEIENSMILFKELPDRNDVTWNTIIVGYFS